MAVSRRRRRSRAAQGVQDRGLVADPESELDAITDLFEGLTPEIRSRPPLNALDGAEKEDREYRRAWGTGGKKPWGQGLRAAFYSVLPESPRGPLTRDQAQQYLTLVERAIDMDCWSRREKEKLRVIRLRWLRRVRGEDPRFLELGGVFGGRASTYLSGAPTRQAQHQVELNRLRREAGITTPATWYGKRPKSIFD